MGPAERNNIIGPSQLYQAGEERVQLLALAQIETRGGTQSRCSLDLEVIREYAALIAMGAELPPVRTWFDGAKFWLSDGFHRLAAAEQAGATQILATVFAGSLSDAQWDSYGANTEHGLRRTRLDIEASIVNALKHPKAQQLSNNQIAKHLSIPEATLRRWRNRLSSPSGEVERIAVRRGTSYHIKIAKIGKRSASRCVERNVSRRELKDSLVRMKRDASPDAHRLLNIIGNWAFGGASAVNCLGAIESLICQLRTPASLP